jgi:hypothetical protein
MMANSLPNVGVQNLPAYVQGRHESTGGSVLSRFEPSNTFHALGGEKICVCSADFSRVRRCHDFCLVQAVVRVVFLVQPSFHPVTATLLTSVQFASASANGSYRQRLIRKAINCFLLMQSREGGELRLTA